MSTIQGLSVAVVMNQDRLLTSPNLEKLNTWVNGVTAVYELVNRNGDAVQRKRATKEIQRIQELVAYSAKRVWTNEPWTESEIEIIKTPSNTWDNLLKRAWKPITDVCVAPVYQECWTDATALEITDSVETAFAPWTFEENMEVLWNIIDSTRAPHLPNRTEGAFKTKYSKLRQQYLKGKCNPVAVHGKWLFKTKNDKAMITPTRSSELGFSFRHDDVDYTVARSAWDADLRAWIMPDFIVSLVTG